MSDSPSNRREHPRVLHPIDATRLGLVETPLTIYDLSLGGCFITDHHQPPRPGKTFTMQIDLPYAEPVTVRVEVLHSRPDFGYAVRFCEVSSDVRDALERSIRRMQADVG